MPPPPKQTMFAQQAVSFGKYFDMFFQKAVVRGDSPRRPRLVVPEGISTGGGKQAVLHVVLRPEDAQAATLTIGWVDQAKGLAKLRSQEFLAGQHRHRFGDQPLPIYESDYKALLPKLKGFFERERIPVQIEAQFKTDSLAPPPDRKPSLLPWLVLGLLLFVVVAGVTAAVVYAVLGWG